MPSATSQNELPFFINFLDMSESQSQLILQYQRNRYIRLKRSNSTLLRQGISVGNNNILNEYHGAKN